jgi:sigma-B regulation protein RsbU (phosphoserine phosphatase)
MRTTRGRILAVDDDAAMLRTVERILSPAHDVRGAASGEEALRLFRDEPSDVAIIDIRMPGMDGYALTRAIKELRPATEVILVTGSVSDLDEKLIRSVQERAGFFITKPFSRSVLTSLVDRCLEIQDLERERDDLIRRLSDDLERARRFQLALLPRGLPKSFGPLHVAAAHLSCERVGGDLYDVAPLPDGRILLTVADVAGHGVAAALVTGMIKTALGATVGENPDLTAVASAVLDTLAPLSQHRMITLLLVLINPRTKSMDYLNAGHPPAIVWGREGPAMLLEATTPLLSFGLGFSKQPVRSHAFRPGDRVALYSDGMYEVRDPAGEGFGRERFTGTVVHAGPERLDQAVKRLLDQAVRHAGGRPPEDDLTLLLAEFAKG